MKNLVVIFFLFPFIVDAQPPETPIIVTVAGNGVHDYSGDGGPATDAALKIPQGAAFDDSGNMYIYDSHNRRIRKVSPGYGGIITTIAGTGTGGYSGDGGLGIYAEIIGASYVAVDHQANVYISEGSRIRKITPGDTITTIAGTGANSYNGDGIAATAAHLNIAQGIAVDDTGNVYIVDELNYRIRKVDTSGIITTIAGTGVQGYSPDGSLADTCRLDHLYSIAVDSMGNVYFTDNKYVRKVSGGIISTVAGNGTRGCSGDGGPATAAEIAPAGLVLDRSGNLFLSNGECNTIRRVGTDGIINTVIGDGIGGYGGDGGPPLLAKLSSPQGIAVNRLGELCIADALNNRVRLVSAHLPVGGRGINKGTDGGEVYPNPAENICVVLLKSSSVAQNAMLVVTDVTGREVARHTITANVPFTLYTPWPAGIYILDIAYDTAHYSRKITVR